MGPFSRPHGRKAFSRPSEEKTNAAARQAPGTLGLSRRPGRGGVPPGPPRRRAHGRALRRHPDGDEQSCATAAATTRLTGSGWGACDAAARVSAAGSAAACLL
eukprot:6944476-Alexandrium_andersonii.AAC.1